MMMMHHTNDMFMRFWSVITTIMFMKAIYEQYIPFHWQYAIQSFFLTHFEKVVRFFSPNTHITFDEYTGEWLDRSKVYTRIQTYLSETVSCKARELKASSVDEDEDEKALVFGLDDYERVTDEFKGVRVWWKSGVYFPKAQSINLYPGTDDRRHVCMYYRLTFHRCHKKLITESYLKHVLDTGKAIAIKKRKRKLFTNLKGSKGASWIHVEFKHPASFDTLAMEPTKKKAIVTDLLHFSKGKDYYAKIGKAWKRGYLLFGRPGTGKSTMIAAMANLLEYDVYDLELTAVEDNTQLRRLLINTSGKSIIVIEDIDCSLDLTGQRSKKKEEDDEDQGEGEKGQVKKMLKELEGEKKKSEVTLSGLLNFIDGIWSSCGEERIIVFTTNHVEKLDPALIRRGRMDMHIELSYCCYEAFKILARNYLNLESHRLFETIKGLLKETNVTPADVAENLIPKSVESDVDVCLENLVSALEKLKEKSRLKIEEEEREGEHNKGS
ncbi:hypothetical protein Cgig2_015353 [Carnegiea gigantea]|uniref:AAA+ ATPase domain-containing protein n=1 Tax=Carnegiea gigantea TaxID=171969 RepID=A0A9Q1K840_9CARY|nr:hypothetical protein Cgig2_015353 [Carnegiea gigantea]